MGSFRAVAALVACSLVVAPSVSVVAQPGPAKAGDGRELVNKATDKSKAGDHRGAIELYLQAYALAPLPLLLTNIASEYEKLTDPVNALKYFCKYLDSEPDGPMASYATQHAKDQQAALHVAVDDNNVCRPKRQEPLPGSGSGSGSTGTGAGSAVVVGGGSGSAAVGGGGVVGGGDQGPPDGGTVAATDPGHGMKRIGLGVAVVGAVGVGLGVVFGIKAQNAADEITNHPTNQPWPNNIGDIESSGSRDQTLQITFLIVGGAALATGAVVYYLGHKKSADGTGTEHATAIAPVAAPGYGGFVLARSW